MTGRNTIRLPEDLVAALDVEAQARTLSRSKLAEMLLSDALPRLIPVAELLAMRQPADLDDDDDWIDCCGPGGGCSVGNHTYVEGQCICGPLAPLGQPKATV